MRFVLLTIGTLGDVVPFVAIGKQIRARGHEVTVATHTDFEAMVRGHGLDYAEVGGSFQTLMDSQAGREWLESAENPIKYRSTAKKILQPILGQWIADCERVLATADVALVHCAAGGAHAAVEARKIPWLVVSPYPWVPSKRGPSIFMPRARPLPIGALNAWLGWRLLQFVWTPFYEQVQAQRVRLGLPRLSVKRWARHVHGSKVHDLHVYSEALVERPADWGAHVEITGFAFLDDGWACAHPTGSRRSWPRASHRCTWVSAA